MSPIRLLFLVAAVTVIGFLVLRESSDDPGETPPLTPEAVDTSISSGNSSAVELIAASEAVQSATERRRAASQTPTASEVSSKVPPPDTPASDAASDHDAVDVQRTLVTEIALLEAERDELYRSLGPLTEDAYQAAWDRNDFEELAAGPTSGREIDGKLVSMRHLPDGRRQMVTLPRAGFEEAYRIYDLSREKSAQVQKKKAELRATQASGYVQ